MQGTNLLTGREQLGVQSLPQGLFDTNAEPGIELRTFRVPSFNTVSLTQSHCHPSNKDVD